MPRRRRRRHAARVQLGNVEPLLQDIETVSASGKSCGPLDQPSDQAKDKRDREVLAAFCRALDHRLVAKALITPRTEKNAPTRPKAHPGGAACEIQTDADLIAHLSPRVSQTLEHLLAGDSEKQIAGKLRLSRHTVHVYVKSLYRSFQVNSRGELLARFVRR